MAREPFLKTGQKAGLSFWSYLPLCYRTFVRRSNWCCVKAALVFRRYSLTLPTSDYDSLTLPTSDYDRLALPTSDYDRLALPTSDYDRLALPTSDYDRLALP